VSERTNLQYDFEAKIIRQIFIDKNNPLSWPPEHQAPYFTEYRFAND